MIRKEVEKLRGTTFTEDEMRDVILPMLSADKELNALLKKEEELNNKEEIEK